MRSPSGSVDSSNRVFLYDAMARLTQANWAVNAATGNDNATGNLNAPLKSLSELSRRFEGRYIPQDVSVLLTGDFSGQRLILNLAVADGHTVAFDAPTTILHSGVVTTFTALNGGTDTPADMTDGALADFTPYIGKRVRFATGAEASILSAPAANTARLSQPVDASAIDATPIPGQTYDIIDLPTSLGSFHIESLGGGDGSVFLPPFSLKHATITDPLSLGGVLWGSGSYAQPYLVFCNIETSAGFFELSAQNTSLIGCLNHNTTLFVQGNGVFTWAHADLDGLVSFIGGGESTIGSASCHQGTVAGVQVTELAILTVAGPIGVFDTTLAVGRPIHLEHGGYLHTTGTGLVWGTGNLAPVAVTVDAASTFLWGIKPTISAASDTLIGGTPKTWAALGATGYVESTNLAALIAA